MEQNIPKIIHYCWFGGNELPPLAKKCIDSWRKYCPDYEIKEWNENNFDVNICKYTKEAHQRKKWAFISDYARFYILYKYGGVYFDTDVELISGIDDIVEKGPFFGMEIVVEPSQDKDIKTYAVNPGLGLGAYPGMRQYKQILDNYSQLSFINEDGSDNLVTVVKYVTDMLETQGYVLKNEYQIIDEFSIYPVDYFGAVDYYTGIAHTTLNSRSLHHYSATWKDEKEQKLDAISRWLNRKFGSRLGFLLSRIVTFPHRINKKIKLLGFKKTIKLVKSKLFKRSK